MHSAPTSPTCQGRKGHQARARKGVRGGRRATRGGCGGEGAVGGICLRVKPARWSVSRVLSPLAGGTAIHLGHRLLSGSSDQPEDPGGAPVPATRAEASSYLTLLQAEFAAFHPASEPKLSGGLVSVALVRASRRTGVTRCLTPWSPDFPRTSPKARSRPSDHLAGGGV